MTETQQTEHSSRMHLLLVLPLVLEVQSMSNFPSDCICHVELKTANCSLNNLTLPPVSLPPTTEQLDLSHNLLSAIHARAFQTTRKLRTLLLNDNIIRVLADEAFFLLEDLLRLDLSRNRISSLREGFSSGLGSLRELSLAENRLTVLDGEYFVHLDSLQKLNLSHNGIRTIRTRAFTSTLRQIHLDWNEITVLTNGIFSTLRHLEMLNLSHNRIHYLDVGVLSPLTSLALLDLTDNNLSSIQFKTFLGLNTYSTHITLLGNPWKCDCDLQRVFRKLRNVKRLFLDDYDNLSCSTLDESHSQSVGLDNELCVAEMVTVLVITLTVFITVVAALVMAEKKRKKKNEEKHWTEVNEMSCTSQG